MKSRLSAQKRKSYIFAYCNLCRAFHINQDAAAVCFKRRITSASLQMTCLTQTWHISASRDILVTHYRAISHLATAIAAQLRKKPLPSCSADYRKNKILQMGCAATTLSHHVPAWSHSSVFLSQPVPRGITDLSSPCDTELQYGTMCSHPRTSISPSLGESRIRLTRLCSVETRT